MEIYGNIGSNDDGTLEAFCTYLGEISTDLVEEQKVYLAHKWIVDNINYDYTGLNNNNAKVEPQQVFESTRLTVCLGYSLLFRKLLLCMNYQENKIKVIDGYSKGAGYSPYTPPISNHAWNAVEINGKWCLIDTT
jgi:transglutaminase/protease-like cytokinesis protein 3